MKHLSHYDLYRLGVLLNSTDNLSYIKFEEGNGIFIAKGKLSTTITAFLRNGLLRVNRKVHVTAFTDDAKSITNISLVRFDLNVDDSADMKLIDHCKNGSYTLTDEEFIRIYEEAALDIMYNYYCELCSMHYRTPEDRYILTPMFIMLIRKLSLYDALDSIFKAHHKYRYNNNSRFNQILEKIQSSNHKDSQIIKVSLKIPYSIEINYLYKLFDIDQTAFMKTEKELLHIYREAHRGE